MKLLFVLFSAVTYHYCNGFPVIDGEISEEVLTGHDTSDDYLFDTTNHTLSNDFLPRQDFFKKIDFGMKDEMKSIVKNIFENRKKKINSFKLNPGSIRRIRVEDTKKAKWPWAFLGIGLILLIKLTWYSCKKDKRDNKGPEGQ